MPATQTEIRLYNTKTRKKDTFVPLDAENVRMYVCGPTVYDRAHLGNARPVIVFDVLFRLLRHVYGADHVTYARNITDVDDKINARAAETGRTIREITDETAGWYLDDMAALGALTPNHVPRATDYIPQMVTMIADLIEKGHAYEAEGHVLFAVESYKNYGALSGRSIDDMIAGARVEVAPYKRNPMDFVLWKPSDASLPGWESPWGHGRPGWHIECSAMAYELLGPTFDIHGGGNDLQFPHHENEIAQSCCANGTERMANVWMHNEMLQVEGKKMSKSLGNFFTVRDLLDQGVSGEVIRFVFLSTHYRKPMDWTEKKRAEAEKALRKIAGLLAEPMLSIGAPYRHGIVKPPVEFVDALSNDLNTSLALTLLNGYAKKGEVHHLGASLMLLGFDPNKLVEKFHIFDFHSKTQILSDGTAHKNERVSTRGKIGSRVLDPLVALGAKLKQLRILASENNNYTELDALKVALVEAGVEVRMTNDGVELLQGPNFNPSKLESLL